MFSHLIRADGFGKSRPAQCMHGEAVIISLARIKRENMHIVCSTASCISVTDDTPNLTRFKHSYMARCEILTCWISDLCTDGIEND